MDFNNASNVWQNLLWQLHNKGQGSSPRNMETMEILGHKTMVDMQLPIVSVVDRHLSYGFMAAEAYWILTGDNRLFTLLPHAPGIIRFSDDGRTLTGAYGPKVVDQLWYVAKTLLRDVHSRQAVISIWRERPMDSKDIPCTLSMQFLIRDDTLHTVVSMRSSDAWLGWPYDVFTFSMISSFVLLTLKSMNPEYGRLDLGDLHLTAGSQHLYMKDEPKARIARCGVDSWKYNPMNISMFNNPDHLLSHLSDLKDGRLDRLTVPFMTEFQTLITTNEPNTSNTIPGATKPN